MRQPYKFTYPIASFMAQKKVIRRFVICALGSTGECQIRKNENEENLDKKQYLKFGRRWKH